MRTIEEVMDLRKRFEDYLGKAEQREFPMLFIVDQRMLKTIETISQVGIEKFSESELESMFRIVERIIGGNKKWHYRIF